MTEQELKEKIVNILTNLNNVCRKGSVCKYCKYENYDNCTEYAIADALIVAGIGDVSEWKHRAEVAERALDKATELAYTYRTQDDTLSCSSCPFDSIFDRCKERGLYEDCSKRWKEELLQQAEKELQEERKDE